jgi:hypothetical protein
MEGQRRGFITVYFKLSGHPNFGDLSGENQDRYTEGLVGGTFQDNPYGFWPLLQACVELEA